MKKFGEVEIDDDVSSLRDLQQSSTYVASK